MLFKAPAGNYTVTATLIGGSGRSQQRQLHHHRQRARRRSHHHVRQQQSRAVSLPARLVAPCDRATRPVKLRDATIATKKKAGGFLRRP